MSASETQYLSVYEFTDQLLAPLYGATEARIRSVNWSARWWAHPEAVARLDALWRRYEMLRVEEPATYMETFLRVHADYHMRQIMSETGAFADCRREDVPTVALPTTPMPQENSPS